MADMHSRVALLLCCISISGCAHGPCRTLGALFGCACTSKPEQPEYQDLSVQLPVFDSELALDTDLDGQTLQAIRIAADDFLGADAKETSCASKQSSHRYRAVRRGDVIFVRIDYKPENCGQTVRMLDAGATYAVSAEGKLLRRSLDGLGDW
jgi:hypothetical protein